MGGACSAYGERRGVHRFLWGNLRVRDHWEDPGADVMIIVRRIFRKWVVVVRIGSNWLRVGTVGGHL